jgi:hypothetical protein
MPGAAPWPLKGAAMPIAIPLAIISGWNAKNIPQGLQAESGEISFRYILMIICCEGEIPVRIIFMTNIYVK